MYQAKTLEFCTPGPRKARSHVKKTALRHATGFPCAGKTSRLSKNSQLEKAPSITGASAFPTSRPPKTTSDTLCTGVMSIPPWKRSKVRVPTASITKRTVFAFSLVHLGRP
jgi:hypothetical protein